MNNPYSDFPKPSGQMTAVEEFSTGAFFYEVIGNWPPHKNEHQILSEPVLFKNSPDWEEFYGEDLGEKYVVTISLCGRGASHRAYLSDLNIGAHHNRNYAFLLEEDADAYLEAIKAFYAERPELVAEIEARRDEEFYEAFNVELD